jgi:alginate export protein
MDLRLGYLELGNFEQQGFGVRVGRQELRYGERRLVGNSNWQNTARSFDAIRATFRHKALRLDAFAASVVLQRDGKFDRSVPGNNLYGLYAGLENMVPNAVLEPYFFWRRAPNAVSETGTHGILNFATFGFRLAGKLPARFDYGTEMARQAGSLVNNHVAAWAGHWLLGYTLAAILYEPRIVAEYNYASGDRNPHDGRLETFDQLYPTNHDKLGFAEQVGWKNVHHIRSGVEFKPGAKWLAVAKYNSWWLASPRDALYNARGAVVARVVDGSAGRYVGQGLDFEATFDASKQIQLIGGFAYLFPGTFLKKATPGSPYTYPYLSLNYIF